MFYNRMPDLSTLRTFGAQVWMHVNSTDRSKTDPPARPGIFVGYDLKWRAYRVLEPGRTKFFFARSVVFDEAKIVNKISKTAREDAQPKGPSEAARKSMTPVKGKNKSSTNTVQFSENMTPPPAKVESKRKIFETKERIVDGN